MLFDLVIQGRKTVKLQLFINNNGYIARPIFFIIPKKNSEVYSSSSEGLKRHENDHFR